MGRFEFFDHEADLGLLVRARSLRELFATAPRGMTALHTEIEKVRPLAARRIEVSAPNRQELLVRWLKEWLYLQNVEGFLVSSVRLANLTERLASGQGRGEKRKPGRHTAVREIKAVTYSGAAIERAGRDWLARLILDV